MDKLVRNLNAEALAECRRAFEGDGGPGVSATEAIRRVIEAHPVLRRRSGRLQNRIDGLHALAERVGEWRIPGAVLEAELADARGDLAAALDDLARRPR